MRLAEFYVRTAVVALLALGAIACQTAQKPVSLLPAAKAPALRSAPRAQTPAIVSQAIPLQPRAAQAPDQGAERPASPEIVSRAPAAAPDAVADLIARAEKEYQAGLAQHQAGRTDEAKQNFDNALNALLSSNLDIRSDDRLQEEFDRIVAGVNQLYP